MKKSLLRHLIMLSKFTIYGFVLQLIVFNTLLASGLLAQKAVSVKEIFVEWENSEMNIVEAFRHIESKTGLSFNYEENDVDNAIIVEFHENRYSVEQILLNISRIANLRFKQINQNINVFKDNNRRINPGVEIVIQDKTITGKVTTKETPEGLPGVNVIIKGTSTGTVTDLNGRYSIDIPSNDVVLVFSSVGYVKEEVTVGDQSVINMNLIPDITALEEIVVVGYGTQKKSDLTGSIDVVDTEDIDNQPVANISEALAGRIPGVQINQGSGSPGSGTNIRIRGTNSLGGSSDPLLIVDGFMSNIGLDQINQADIESIQVLKDASATAIYGTRGANGVIIVTTKRGAKDTPPQISFNSYWAMQELSGNLELMNAEENAQYYQTYEPPLTNIPNPGDPDLTDEDWLGAITNDPATQQNYYLGVSGGSNKMKYSSSVEYLDQAGIIKATDYKRINLRTNLDFNVNDMISFGTNFFYRNVNKNGTQIGQTADKSDAFRKGLEIAPFIPIRNPDGSYNSDITVFGTPAQNPVERIEEFTDLRKRNSLNMQGFVELVPFEGVSFKSRLSFLNVNTRNQDFIPSYTFTGTQEENSASYRHSVSQSFEWVNTLNIDKEFGKNHILHATLGYMAQERTTESLQGTSSDFPDEFEYFNLGATSDPARSQANSSFLHDGSLLSYLGRINYTLFENYLFTVTGRYDGSSRFGANNKFAFFPSFALAWKVGDETFFSSTFRDNVDFKIRASWGQTGNERIPPLLTQGRFSANQLFFNEELVTRYSATVRPNPDLKWETTSQLNIGFDLSLFNNKYRITGDYFKKNTTDLLASIPVSSTFGAKTITSNIGEIENEGIEFKFEGNLISTKDLSWSGSINFSSVRNEIVSLTKDSLFNEIIIEDVGLSSTTDRTIIMRPGSPIGSFYTWVSDGIYHNQEEVDADPVGVANGAVPGDVKIVDINNDGIINEDDKQITGNPNPDFSIGWNNNFEYKSFELNLFFQGVFGNDILNFTRFGLIHRTADRLGNNWTPERQSATQQRAANSTSGGKTYITDDYVEDGSYIRLRNVNLIYHLPSSFLTKVNIESANIYVSAQNLFTFTDYSGFNPEVTDSSEGDIFYGLDRFVYPTVKTYTLGVNVNF